MPNLYISILLFFSLTLFFHRSEAKKIDSLFFETSENYLFEENKGQWPENILFKTLLKGGGSLFFEKNKLLFRFEALADSASFLSHCPEHNHRQKIKGHVYFLEFLNSAPNVQIEKKEKVGVYKNYFIGNDPKNWARHVNSYKEIIYKNLYDKIDLKFYESNNALKYDFILSPGAKSDNILLKYTGIDKLSIDATGNLVLLTSVNQIIELSPVAYQVIQGKPQNIKCKFLLVGKDKVTFQFPEGYDTTLPLVIDPQLIFSTFSGASSPLTINLAYTSTFGSDSSLFTGSIADNQGIPTTPGAYQVNFRGGYDIVLYKFNAAGTRLVWATYIGGNSSNSTAEYPLSLITDAQNNLYLLGATQETNFPTTARATQRNNAGNLDFIISKLSANGAQLLASTYLGGSATDGQANNAAALALFYTDHTRGEINLDGEGNVIIIGSSNSQTFPGSNRSFSANNRGVYDAIVAKLSPNLDFLHWSAFLGGGANDAGYGLRINKNNDIVVIGGSTSNNFPTTPGVWQPNFRGGEADGFVSVIQSNGSRLLHSSYIGTNNFDQALVLDLDKDDNIYIAGQTRGAFPVFPPGVYNNPNSGQFIIKLPPNLSFPYFSSRFGSQNNDIDITLSAMLVDVCENIYLSGWGGFRSTATAKYEGSTFNLPHTEDPFNVRRDKSNYYLVAFSPNMQALSFATFIGNSNIDEHQHGGTNRFDKNGIIYQSSCLCLVDETDRTNLFPTTPGAFSRNWESGVQCLTGAFKFDFDLLVKAKAKFTIADACDKIEFKNQSKNGKEFKWYFGDGDSSLAESPGVHHFKAPGVYTITLVATNREKCNISDTTQLTVTIPPIIKPGFIIVPDSVCGLIVEITDTSQNAVNVTWDMGNGIVIRNPGRNFTYPYAQSGEYVITQYLDTASFCGKTFTRKIDLHPPIIKPGFIAPDSVCGLSVEITDTSQNAVNVTWDMGNGIVIRNPGRNFTYPYAQSGEYIITQYLDTASFCGKTFTRKIHLQAPPQPNFNFSLTDSCGGIQITNNSSHSADAFWEVHNGQFFEPFDPSEYRFRQKGEKFIKLKVKGIPSCNYTDSIIKKVVIPQNKAIANFSVPEKICGNQIIVIDKSEGGDIYKYAINDTITYLGQRDTLIHTISEYGKYNIRLIIDEGDICGDTLVKETTLNPIPKVVIRREPQICILDQKFSADIEGADIWKWSFSNGQNSEEREPIASFEEGEQTVQIIVTNSQTGCSAQKNESFQLESKAKAIFEVSSSCERKIPLTSQSIDAFSYRWLIGSPILAVYTRKDTFHIFENAGRYSILHIINENTGCADSALQYIDIFELPKAEFEIWETPCTLATTLKARTNNDIEKISWYINRQLKAENQSLLELELNEGVNLIKNVVTNKLGCKDSLEKEFNFEKHNRAWFEIPNVFSPNNDGINDFFEISVSRPDAINCIENIQIYDRWGNIVFEDFNPPFRWDGNYSGAPTKEGTYFYLILFQNNGKRSHRSGTVTVIR